MATAGEQALGRCRACPAQVDELLLRRLKQWRKEQLEVICADAGKRLPAYLVATDATLAALAEARPRTMDALAAMPGLGPAKLTRYGTELLAVINDDDVLGSG